jgi:hypothetical protein
VSLREFDDHCPCPTLALGYWVAERVAHDLDRVVIVGRYDVIERVVRVPVEPEPGLREAVWVEVVHEKGVQHVSLEILMNRPEKWSVMRDDDIRLRLTGEAEMCQVEIIPPVDRRTLNLGEVGKPAASRIASPAR